MTQYPVPINNRDVLAMKLVQASHAADNISELNTLQEYKRLKRPNTIRRQKVEIALFEKFLAELSIPLEGMKDDLSLWAGMSRGLIIAFRLWLEKNGYRAGYINLCMSTLRVYCEMAYTAKYLSIDSWQPIAQIHDTSASEARIIDESRPVTSVGLKKAEPTPIKPAQLALLKRKLRQINTPVSIRTLLIICLLADHAMRVSEVASLQRSQVDLDELRFLIDRRKTDTQHYHKFVPDALEALNMFLDLYERAPDETLIGIGIASIRAHIVTAGKLIGLNLSPHDLRHYYATYARGNLLDIAKAGGWTNINMILRYRLASENANENVTMPTSEGE